MSRKPLLNVTEVALILKRSDAFVLREIRRKNLRGSKIGGAWSVDEGDLDTYIDAKANVARVRRAS
jgi:hypothetical protein